MSKSFVPLKEKEYIVTDQCMWQEMTPEEQKAYNPYDTKRAPHTLEIVDKETGTVAYLASGSVIKVIKAR